MKKIILITILLSSMLLSESLLSQVQKSGLIIKGKSNEKILIQREQSPLCTKDNINPKSLFGGDFAGNKVASVCKKTFVTKVGVLQPMKLGKGIKTVGELEVLVHIENTQKNPSDYVLIDARTKQWFEQMTIPSSKNIPFNEINYMEESEKEDFDNDEAYKMYTKQLSKLFKVLNIKRTAKGLDFSNVKSVVFYCNGSWCSQSPNAIFKLINMGYPKEKILWYRGGLQDWLIYDFTVTKENS